MHGQQNIKIYIFVYFI